MSDKRKLAEEYVEGVMAISRDDRPTRALGHDVSHVGTWQVIWGPKGILLRANAEANYPQCFAPDPPKPKEPKRRPLRKRYKRVQEYGRDARTFIVESGPDYVAGRTRDCWVEGVDPVPDKCHIPEPAPPAMPLPTGRQVPSTQVFRKGDMIRHLLFRPAGRREFLQVTNPDVSPESMTAVDGDGKPWRCIDKAKAELICRCPSRPTGPPVVGSCVRITGPQHVQHGQLHIVSGLPRGTHITTHEGGSYWFSPDQVEHIAAPPESKT